MLNTSVKNRKLRTVEKLALRHRLKIQSDCNRRWLLGTSRHMMDDFLLKWQLCCVSAILLQHKSTGRLLWLFNSYHCGKLISNLWRAISGWQGTFGLFLSFSFLPFFFLSLFANLTKDAHWSSPGIYLRQPGNKEQNRAVLAPASSLLQWWEPTWEGRAGGPEPPSSSPPTTASVLGYPEN